MTHAAEGEGKFVFPRRLAGMDFYLVGVAESHPGGRRHGGKGGGEGRHSALISDENQLGAAAFSHRIYSGLKSTAAAPSNDRRRLFRKSLSNCRSWSSNHGPSGTSEYRSGVHLMHDVNVVI